MLRIIVIASAALIATLPAVAQQTADPPVQPPAAAAVADEPREPSTSREEVFVTAAPPVPVQGVEGATTFEQRQRHRPEAPCVLQAQDAADPTEPELGAPEEVCREP